MRLGGDVATRQDWFVLDFAEMLILNKSILGNLQTLLGRGAADFGYAARRRRLSYLLDELPSARASVAENIPVFVLAHLLAPHPPFVFDQSGGDVSTPFAFSYGDGDHWYSVHGRDPRQYQRLYRDQAIYTMNKLGDTISEILQNSPRPPVIILQAGHGPGSLLTWEEPRQSNIWERQAIYNAFYFPQDMRPQIGPDITPVNSFRVVFNTILDTDLPLLSNQFWFARWSRPYDFVPVGL